MKAADAIRFLSCHARESFQIQPGHWAARRLPMAAQKSRTSAAPVQAIPGLRRDGFDDTPSARRMHDTDGVERAAHGASVCR